MWFAAGFLGAALAQSQPAGNAAKYITIKVKPGMGTQFEEAYKQHLEWHKINKDPWIWTAFQFETGKQTGQWSGNVAGYEGAVYTVASFHPDWASVGEFESSMIQIVTKDLGQWETNRVIESFWEWVKSSRSDFVRFRPDLSYSSSGDTAGNGAGP